jgi:hypothetical protein
MKIIPKGITFTLELKEEKEKDEKVLWVGLLRSELKFVVVTVPETTGIDKSSIITEIKGAIVHVGQINSLKRYRANSCLCSGSMGGMIKVRIKGINCVITFPSRDVRVNGAFNGEDMTVLLQASEGEIKKFASVSI